MQDLVNHKFGNLTVLYRDTSKPSGHGHSSYWVCQCDCGSKTSVRVDHLKGGKTKSCGHILGDNTKTESLAKAAINNKIIQKHETYSEISLSGVITLIDNQFLDEVMRWNWLVSNAGYLFRHLHKRDTVWLHRYVMALPPKEKVVDHKNHNQLDNRRENLRICTPTENAWNTVLRKNKKISYKGVYKTQGRFCARITVHGKNISLGLYDTPEKAYEVYCEAAKQYFGEFYCPG